MAAADLAIKIELQLVLATALESLVQAVQVSLREMWAEKKEHARSRLPSRITLALLNLIPF